MKKLMAGLVLSAVVLVTAPGTAFGKPEPFQVSCEGVTYTITSGNGEWAVGSDVSSSTHFIPKSFTFTVTDAEGKVLFSESITKKGHRNQPTVTCTFGETDPGTGETFSGSATVVKKP